MKNLLKVSFKAFLICLPFLGCNSDKRDTKMSDSSVMTDSALIDTGRADTLARDTGITM